MYDGVDGYRSAKAIFNIHCVLVGYWLGGAYLYYIIHIKKMRKSEIVIRRKIFCIV